jgi:Helix-turn-helix domain
MPRSPGSRRRSVGERHGACEHRQRKGRARVELRRLSGIPARWLTALERGQLEDVSFAEVGRLAEAIGTTERAFLAEFTRRLHLALPPNLLT